MCTEMERKGQQKWACSAFITVWFICLSFQMTHLSVGASIPEPSTPEPGTPESTAEPKPESTTEPKSESTAEPKSESTGEAKSESTAEPKSESTAEPKSESSAEPKAESKSEPSAESEPPAKPEPANEPNSETTSEPETKTEISTEPEGEPETRPSTAEVLLPPFSLIILIVAGLFLLSLKSRYKLGRKLSLGRIKAIFVRPVSRSPVSVTPCTERSELAPSNENVKEAAFLTAFDLEALESLKTFNNRPSQMCKIAAPAVLSLALCPILLYIYEPMVKLFWPDVVGQPNINEAIACFLAPAGLVYATSFGFAFQQVLAKQQDLLTKISYEIGLLDQILTLSSKLSLPSQELRMSIYKALKAEAMFMILQIEDRKISSFKCKPIEDVKVKIWEILDLIRCISVQSKVAFDVDRIIAEKIVSHILQLNSICSDRMGQMHARIHPLKWAFLETLGFFSFFGVLLLRAQSYRMELTMCIITVFSISLLCYVVSDLDSPFSGYFRIDISVITDVVRRTQQMHDHAVKGKNVLCHYPEKL